jgi:predicted nucleic acid-binding protein
LNLLNVVEISAEFEEELRPTKLKTFLDIVLPIFERVDYGLPEALLTGEIYRKLEAGRKRIGLADTAIAATAVTKGLTVVTSNTEHFQRIIDLGYPLAIENWREPKSGDS